MFGSENSQWLFLAPVIVLFLKRVMFHEMASTDLSAGIQQQTTNRGEDNSDCEEEGEDGLRCEDWSAKSMVNKVSRANRSLYMVVFEGLTAMPLIFVVGKQYL